MACTISDFHTPACKPVVGQTSMLRCLASIRQSKAFFGLNCVTNAKFKLYLTSDHSSREFTWTLKVSPKADVTAAAADKPPGPPPMIATSTSVAYAFACVLTDAVIERDRLQVSRLLSRTSNKQHSNKVCFGSKPALVGFSGTAILPSGNDGTHRGGSQ